MQIIAEETARLISREMKERGLSVRLGEGIPSHTLGIRGHGIWPPPGYYEIHVIRHPTTIDFGASREEIIKKWLMPVAIEIGIKLARPFPVTAYELENPIGLDEAGIGVALMDGIYLQVIRAFDIGKYEFITRFQMLVQWEDSAG
jgi:hypothetical protein